MKARCFARCSFVVLWLWFLFAITGLSIGSAVYAVRDFDLMTTIWFVGYTLAVVLFFLKEKVAKFVIIVYTFIWVAMQGLNWILPKSANGIAQYNRIFEGSHYIIPPSDTIIMPNTYHLILLCLILIAFISSIVFMVSTKKDKPTL